MSAMNRSKKNSHVKMVLLVALLLCISPQLAAGGRKLSQSNGLLFAGGYVSLTASEFSGGSLDMFGVGLGYYISHARTQFELDVFARWSEAEFVRNAKLVGGGTTEVYKRDIWYLILLRGKQHITSSIYASVGAGLYIEEVATSSGANPNPAFNYVYPAWSVGIDLRLTTRLMIGVQRAFISKDDIDGNQPGPGWRGLAFQLTFLVR